MFPEVIYISLMDNMALFDSYDTYNLLAKNLFEVHSFLASARLDLSLTPCDGIHTDLTCPSWFPGNFFSQTTRTKSHITKMHDL